MMSAIADLLLAFSIIGGAVVFTVANANYVPEKDEEK